MKEQIICKAFHGGLEAKHGVNTCLSRIAMNRANGDKPFPECDSCGQAKGFMAKYPSVIEGKAAAYKKKIVSNQKAGISAQFLRSPEELMRQKSYRESEMRTRTTSTTAGEGVYSGTGSLEPTTHDVSSDNKPSVIIESPPEPIISPAPPCIKCGKNPQIPRQRRGKAGFASYCRECLNVSHRQSYEARIANKAVSVTISFRDRQELFQEIAAAATQNERTVLGEIFYRLRGGQ